MKFEFRGLAPYVFLIIVNFFTWFPTLSLNFFNDNYQILSYLEKATQGNLAKVFAIKDLSSGYYRPIPNFFHLLLLKSFAYNPLPFYLFQLVIYILLVSALYKLIYELTKSESLAIMMAGFFLLLPSHDIYLSWIATNGDLLATLFVLTTVYCFIIKKSNTHFFIGCISTILAYLSKESTFVLPFFLFAFAIYTRNWSIRNLKIIFGTLVFLLLLLILREIFLDIHLSASKNLTFLNMGDILLNFPISLALNFFPTFALSTKTSWSFGMLLLFLIYVLIFLKRYKLCKPNFQEHIYSFQYGLLWIIFFSIPLLPLLMRWYTILPSIGLIIIFVYFFQTFRFEKKQIFALVIPILSLFVAINIYSQKEWHFASKTAQEILSASKNIKTKKSKVIFWFVPYYYNSYYVLRSGTHQAFEFFSKVKYSEILFPMPTKILKGYKVRLINQNEKEFEFSLENLKDFSNESTTTQKSKARNDYYKVEIIKQKFKIIIRIKFLKKKEEYENYFFNGNNFVWFY